ncbi:MAG TPA: bifunctional nuclease domain-containing protein [Myxococcota bacterium]
MDVVVGFGTITLDPRDGHAVAIFFHAPSGRCLPLWIDDVDAAALAAAVRGDRSTTSSSAALLAASIEVCGGAVDRVQLQRVQGGVLRAVVVVAGSVGLSALPARASTAITLALLSGAPILIDDGLLTQIHARLHEAAKRAGHDDGVDTPTQQTATERWNLLLAHLADRVVDERPS